MWIVVVAIIIMLLSSFLCFRTAWKAYILVQSYTIPVQGRYLGRNRHTISEGKCVFEPVFAYSYQNVHYETQVEMGYVLEKSADQKYEIGGTYPIWIREDAPDHCIDRRNIPANYMMTLFLGNMMLIICGYIIFTLFIKF